MSYFAGDYDVAVIGAGHAGCEAGLACARMGMKTLLFSIKKCLAFLLTSSLTSKASIFENKS